LLRSAYLADSPFSWAHIVILAIGAAGHGVDIDVCCLAYFASTSLVGGGDFGRGRLQPFQSAQQSVDAGPVPFAAECGWYFPRVQRARDGLGREARFPKFMNCLAQRLGSHVRSLLECQSIVLHFAGGPKPWAASAICGSINNESSVM
jgi:hypothetical protein